MTRLRLLPPSVQAAAAVALVLAPCGAGAAMQYRLQPAFALSAGADDDVLFNGQGGDRIGRVAARLNGRIWDRGWSARADLSASMLGFQKRWSAVPLGEGRLGLEVRPGRRTQIASRLRLRVADDPLALAQVGLLAGAGRTFGFKGDAQLVHRLTPRVTLAGALVLDGVRFLDPSPVSDGQSLGAIVSAPFRYSRTLTILPAVDGRVFLSDGPAAGAAGVVPGARFRLARRTFLEAAAGPRLYFDALGAVWLAAARLEFSRHGRRYATGLSASHDLTIPSSRGGVLAGEQLEGLGRYFTADWEMRVRAGMYRSRPSPRDPRSTLGYGVEGAAFRRLYGSAWLGLSVLRFARVADAAQPGLIRDAVYGWLEFTGGRP